MKTPKEILDSEFATQNLTGMVRDGVINAMNQYAEEKLRDEQHQNTLLAQKCSDLADELKQKEDENRELVEILQILQPWVSNIGWIHAKENFFNMNDRIHKALK